MTTATKIEQPLTDPEAVQAALVRKLAATKDPLDAQTDREKQALVAQRAALEQHIRIAPGLIERRATPTAQRAVAQAALDKLQAVEPILDKLIKDAPDWRTIADNRERDAEWERQNALAASKTALYQGVQYFGGQPGLPTPLRQLLTPPPCAACQRPHEVFWPGPIVALEAEIAALDKQIAEAQFFLDSHLKSARVLLGEAALDAEDKAYRQTHESLHLKVGVDGRLQPYRSNGSELPASELTPDQKKVLARANAAQTGITTPAIAVEGAPSE